METLKSPSARVQGLHTLNSSEKNNTNADKSMTRERPATANLKDTTTCRPTTPPTVEQLYVSLDQKDSVLLLCSRTGEKAFKTFQRKRAV